ncbi:MMPL family transporter [Streptomyces arenae]|uniref:MMPL family transporter n=1 Tax=Streptomyces arenae TaxID=29301 RepID=UPI003D27ACAF
MERRTTTMEHPIPGAKRPMVTVRIARWSATHPWRAIVGWVLFVAVCVAVGGAAGTRTADAGAVRDGLPNRQAVARGITTSVGTVTSAAVVMVAVFSIFGTLTTLDMKQLGVGLAAAILLDATIIRAVVLPAAMIMLGEWNWWTPRPLRREQHAVPERLPAAAANIGSD